MVEEMASLGVRFHLSTMARAWSLMLLQSKHDLPLWSRYTATGILGTGPCDQCPEALKIMLVVKQVIMTTTP